VLSRARASSHAAGSALPRIGNTATLRGAGMLDATLAETPLHAAKASSGIATKPWD
jgi:hypothetical protein